MGTAGGLALARDRGLLGSGGSVLVINGDGILNLRLDPLFERHIRSREEVTLALLPHLDPGRWTRVLLDDRGKVRELRPPGPVERSEVPLLYPGVMAIARRALDRLDARPGDLPERLWTPARGSGELGGAVVPGHWREVGSPRDYLEVALTLTGESPAIDGTAEIHPGARLGRALVGRGVRIEAGAVVGDAVLGEGVLVRCGARVVRSVLLGPIEVEAGEDVVDEFRAAPLRLEHRAGGQPG
jgi:NDP-sugar pyrophosphorylase family protein